MDLLTFTETQITKIEGEIRQRIAEVPVEGSGQPLQTVVDLWKTIPGVDETTACVLAAEIGTRKGSVWLRRALCQAAWAASRTKNTYLSALYRRLIVRKGKKRTIVAVAHSILLIAYHMLQAGQTYKDLGADYFDRLDQQALTRRLVRRLNGLGYEVALTASAHTT
jgi:hypothetical protein